MPGRTVRRFLQISIHALREEGDIISFILMDERIIFLSTPSARRATIVTDSLWVVTFIFLSTPSARRATFEW